MVEYGKILSKALKFSVRPKRWLPFFMLDLAFFMLAALFVLSNLSVIVSFMLAISTSPLAIVSVLEYIAFLAVGFIAWMLVRIWIQGAVIHQSHREKEFRKSFRVSFQRYLSMLGTMIVVTIVTVGAASVPWVGWLLAIIVGLVFFFVLQSVIVGGLGFEKSLTESYRIFRKNPLSVFLSWLSIAIIALVIMFIFSLPSIAMTWGIINPYFAHMGTATAVTSVLFLLLTNAAVLLVGGVIFLAGSAIATSFSMKAQTEFYKQLRKKKLF